MLLRLLPGWLIVAAFFLGPAAAAAEPASCKAPGSRPVAKNDFARVYEMPTDEGTGLFGCVRRSGRDRLIAEAYDDDYVSSAGYANVRLAGRYVAWSWTATDISCKAACPPGYDTTTEGIATYDLRRRRARGVAGAVPLGRALVLSRTGGFAWAGRRDLAGPVEIHASIRGSEDRVLDSGNIDPGSLTIEITIISWLRDGVERFARLR